MVLPFHPLDPPSPDEIAAAGATVKTHAVEKLGLRAFKITNVYLKEPEKNAVIEYFRWPGGAATKPASGKIERQVEVHVVDAVGGRAYEIYVTLPPSAPQPIVTETILLPEGVQPAITVEELEKAEDNLRKSPKVIEALKEIGVEPHQLYADGWSVGWDTRFPGRRLQEAYCYARFGSPDDNHYAHPLDFAPVLDSNTGEVLSIDYPPMRTQGLNRDLSTSATSAPPPAGFNKPDPNQRPRYGPPRQKHEWHPKMVQKPDNSGPNGFREDLKPIQITQPRGVSFVRTGNVLEWQKWKVHVGFHPREGIVLSTISYKDSEAPGASLKRPEERPLFYRASLAEMVVPYSHPDYPWYKKFAFDVGEYGLGMLSNSLSLGCDCQGAIEYMDGHLVQHDGSVRTVKNAVCIHEEDAGTLWTHADFRPNGLRATVRQRKLVISSVYTVANYEYKASWEFFLDGTWGCKINLTGILNLSPLGPGETTTYGNEVAPRINAQYHQHLFSVRIDPHIDGPLNSVVEQHVESSPYPTGHPRNWAGNAYIAPQTIFETTGDGVRDAHAESERGWVIVNENKTHYANGKPVGFKLVVPQQPKLLAHHDSLVATRAPFAKHALWAVPYKEGRLYPAGKHVVQTSKTPADTVEAWVGDGTEPIRNKDIVLFFTTGITHLPRAEDFPVMPSDEVAFYFKPNFFFPRNPAMDIKPTNDPASVPANAEGSTCCQAKL